MNTPVAHDVVPEPRAAPSGPPAVERLWHICVLSAFAVTAPLLQALLRQTTFLHDRQVGLTEGAALLAVLLLALPAALALVDLALECAARRCGGWGRNGLLFGLFALAALTVARIGLNVRNLQERQVVWLATLATALAAAAWLTRRYDRALWLRRWLTWSGLGVLAFPADFLWRLPQANAIARAADPVAAIPVPRPLTVIVVVFDEFSGITLRNAANELDAARYPNFARLAGQSTWYRNATTVHARTDHAVPALLTGRFPTGAETEASSQQVPNLLQLMSTDPQRDWIIFEPVTRLTPDIDLTNRQPRSLAARVGELTYTLACVYPRLILPTDTPLDLPPIPRAWFGMPASPDVARALRAGVLRYGWDSVRREQLEHFLDCLRADARPQFAFLHVALPHIPWSYLPDGRRHEGEGASTVFPEGSFGDVGEDWGADELLVRRHWLRYLLQVGFVDRFVGQLLDRLEETGQLERCLLVVTADHGVSFAAGHSRRVPDAQTLPEILSVPLFVKYPGQTQGAIDDSNVETIDVLPTIAAELQVDWPTTLEGRALQQAHEPPRPRKTLRVDDRLVVVEPSFPQQQAAVARQEREFGSGTPLDELSDRWARPEWQGRRVADFVVGKDAADRLFLSMHEEYRTSPPGGYRGCLLKADLVRSRAQGPRELVALAVDGVICGTTFLTSAGWEAASFSAVLPAHAVAAPPHILELFVTSADAAAPVLQRVGRFTLTAEGLTESPPPTPEHCRDSGGCDPAASPATP